MQPRLRYDIATLLVLIAVIAFHLAVYRAFNPYRSFHPRKILVRSTADKNGVAMIHWAIRHHKKKREKDVVDFVVIERISEGDELRSRVHTTGSSIDYHPSTVLELPHRVIELPSDEQLLQLSNGEFTTLEGNVDVEDLTEFLSAFSSQSTIQELAAMAETKE